MRLVRRGNGSVSEGGAVWMEGAVTALAELFARVADVNCEEGEGNGAALARASLARYTHLDPEIIILY